MAFGEMGLTPSELESYTMAQFDVKCRGFQRTKDFSEKIARRMTGFIVAPHLSKKSSFIIEKAWPILSVDGKREYRHQALFSKEKVKAMMDLIEAEKKQ